MIGRNISNYCIIGKLGDGGMGVVYLGEHLTLKSKAAIKTIKVEPGKQDYRQRFLREACTLAKLRHPNIAHVYDYGETPDGIPYLVMELVEGQTLKDLLAQKRLTLASSLQIIGEVAEALAEAHRGGVIHRDIKPSNIIVNERGEVKVVDFGIAKSVKVESPATGANADGLGSTVTSRDVIVGTPGYLSPEQAVASRVDARSDIFSLGALLYECIAGRPAFQGKDADDIRSKMLYDDPLPPSEFNREVSPDLDRLTLKALAKKADDRFQTADEFLTSLTRVHLHLADRETPPVPVGIPPVRSDPSIITTFIDTIRRPRLLVGVFLAAVTAALLLVGGASLYRRSPSLPPPHPEAVRSYTEGVDALVNGSYYRASRALQRAIGVDGKFALAHARLAETFSELDYEDKAKEAMLRADALLLTNMSGLSTDDATYVQAIHSAVTGDFEGAAAKYLEIAGRISDQNKALAYMSAARALEKSGFTGKAVETYRLLIEQHPQSAAAFLRLGVIHGRKLSQADAFGAFQTAEALYREQNNLDGVAEVLYQRGYLLNNLGKPDEAREHLQLALDTARAADAKPQAIKTLVQMGISFYLGAKSDIAEQYITSAVELAQAEGNENLVTNGLVDLGNVFYLRGKYDVAEKYFKQALEIAARSKGRRAEARAALSLGSLRMQQGKTDAAINSVEQALSFYNQGQYYKETSSALLLLGRARDYKGDYAAALEALGQQFRIAQKVGDQAQVAQSHVELGTSLQHQERYVEALEHFETSHRINQSLGLNQNVGYDLMNRGHLLWQLGRYDEARAVLDEAATVARRPGGENRQLLAWVEFFNARLALSRRDFPTAREKSEAAYQLSGQQFKDIAAQARYVSGLTFALSGTPRVGILQCNEALALAQLTGDPRLVAYAKLALAEAQLEGGDAGSALNNALSAQESFGRSGHLDSHWRALLIAALAERRMGEHGRAGEYARHATAVLSELSRRWGDAFGGYANRPDVQSYRGRLLDVIASVD